MSERSKQSSFPDQDIVYDPTLYIYQTVAEGGDGISEYADENAKRVSERHREVFAEALETAVRITAGSDAGLPNIPHPTLHHELDCIVKGSMTEAEALTAAAKTPADELDRPELGVLVPGSGHILLDLMAICLRISWVQVLQK